MKSECYFMLADNTMCDNRLCAKAFAIQEKQSLNTFCVSQGKYSVSFPRSLGLSIPQFLLRFYEKLSARQIGTCKCTTHIKEYTQPYPSS